MNFGVLTGVIPNLTGGENEIFYQNKRYIVHGDRLILVDKLLETSEFVIDFCDKDLINSVFSIFIRRCVNDIDLFEELKNKYCDNEPKGLFLVQNDELIYKYNKTRIRYGFYIQLDFTLQSFFRYIRILDRYGCITKLPLDRFVDYYDISDRGSYAFLDKKYGGIFPTRDTLSANRLIMDSLISKFRVVGRDILGEILQVEDSVFISSNCNMDSVELEYNGLKHRLYINNDDLVYSIDGRDMHFNDSPSDKYTKFIIRCRNFYKNSTKLG